MKNQFTFNQKVLMSGLVLCLTIMLGIAHSQSASINEGESKLAFVSEK